MLNQISFELEYPFIWDLYDGDTPIEGFVPEHHGWARMMEAAAQCKNPRIIEINRNTFEEREIRYEDAAQSV